MILVCWNSVGVLPLIRGGGSAVAGAYSSLLRVTAYVLIE